MKQFIKQFFRFALIGLIPFLVLLAGYFYYDPFKVLYDYNDYSYPYVVPNRDDISTEMFIKNKEKYKYNSFIFGSSRTLAYKPASWKKYLDENAHPFMFDGSNESIYGIYLKLKYLDSTKVPINNALIILCRDMAFAYPENPKGHLFIKHPLTSGENRLAFQNEFFKAYLSPKFLFNFYDYTFTKEYKPYMKGYIENRKVTYDTITNEVSILDQEAAITQNPVQYYNERKSIFFTRPGERVDPAERLTKQHLQLLQEIKRILTKNNTHYKIVLSPLYEQMKFSPHDINILKGLFGNHLYDFSGKNNFTDPVSNYYELSHYRPVVGDSILNIIYK